MCHQFANQQPLCTQKLSMSLHSCLISSFSVCFDSVIEQSYAFDEVSMYLFKIWSAIQISFNLYLWI